MDYKIEFKASVKKDIKKLSKDRITEILNKIETQLPQIAFHQPSLKGKFKHLKKYRIGDFRVIYTIVEDTILILRIADRKDVYRKWIQNLKYQLFNHMNEINYKIIYSPDR